MRACSTPRLFLLVAFTACRTEVKIVPAHLESKAGADAESLVGEVVEVATPVSLSCVHEDPPTSFTGGLVYYREIVPEGGAFEVLYEGRVIERLSGTIDWDKGQLETVDAYIDDYTAVEGTDASAFVFQDNGDSTANGTSSVLFKDGSGWTLEGASEKEGCLSASETVNPSTGEVAVVRRELVSPDLVEYEHGVLFDEGNKGWSFYAVGENDSTWTTTYTFESEDDPDSKPSPDREGTCTSWGDGTSACEAIDWGTDEDWVTHLTVWETSGAWVDEWEETDPDSDFEPATWGDRWGEYEGSGGEQWWIPIEEELIIFCEGTWDVKGVGEWGCDNGTEGTYTAASGPPPPTSLDPLRGKDWLILSAAVRSMQAP